MNKREETSEMKDLILELNRLTEFYDKGTPEVSDLEWDRLYFKLQKLEKETGVVLPNSPTHKIHYEVKSELEKVEHNHPLLSLAKTKSIDELEDFIGDKHYTVMAKMDGLTISVRYVDGKLVSAETRGDGVIGEDVLHNALTIKNLPHRIDYKDELIIDGEAIITYKDFEKFKDSYANPRNLVSGSIRLLDSKEAAERDISFVAWKVYKGFNEEEWYSIKLFRLEKLGFTIVPLELDDDPYYNIEDRIHFIKDTCTDLGYPIDGCVIGIDGITEAAAMGDPTQHHERYQLAFKFYDDEYETTFKDIEYDVSRTGQMTPVAIFEEVDTGDSIISRASLHNISVMHDILGYPYKGQKIWVNKANAIIPQVVRAEKNNSNVDIYIPNKCPVCGGPVSIHVSNAGIENLYCDNPLCSRKLAQRIEFFGSKKALDIKGLSLKTIEKLIDWGWINSIKDLYSLSDFRNEWIKKPGFGAASVDKILQAIQVSRDCLLDRFICACMIPEIGTKASKDLAKKFITWDNFRKATYDDLISIDGFGDVMCSNIIDFDYAEMDEIAKLMYHLNITETFIMEVIADDFNNYVAKEVEKVLPLIDKTFVITGRLQLIQNREKLINIVERYGGKVTSSISKNTQYLINNDINSNSSKNRKAKELNIPIISEQDFFNMIGGFNERFNK